MIRERDDHSQTFIDLKLDLLQRVRQDRNSTATAEQAGRYVNSALLDMHVGFGERFPWTERSAILVTHPTYSDGTVLIAQGSNLLFGVGATAWTSNNVYLQQNVRIDGTIRVEGQLERYRVLSVTAPGQLDLVDRYLGETVTSAAYTYYEDEYDLAADFARPIDLTRFTEGPDGIGLVGRKSFRSAVEGRYDFGRPEIATLIDRPAIGNTTPRRRVRLWPIPEKAYQLSYSYVTSKLVISSAGVAQEQFSADTDEPIVPIRYRHAIVLHALYHWYRDKRDDTRSQEARAEYLDLVTRISGDSEMGSEQPRTTPRTRGYQARSRRPWGRGLGRFDVGNSFDRLLDRE